MTYYHTVTLVACRSLPFPVSRVASHVTHCVHVVSPPVLSLVILRCSEIACGIPCRVSRRQHHDMPQCRRLLTAAAADGSGLGARTYCDRLCQ